MSTIDLFRITLDADIWTFTNVDQDQVYDAGFGDELYVSTKVKRGGYEQKNELSKADIEISIPIDHEISVQVLTAYVEQVMSLTIFTNRNGSVSISWKGRLSTFKPSDAFLTLSFESIFTSLRRPGLRARFQRSCRHTLYGHGCRLLASNFAIAGQIDALSGTVLTVSEAASYVDGYFIGGMLSAPDGALAYIINHIGDQITLQRMNYSLQTAWDQTGAGLECNIYPGCDHTRVTCHSKFNNVVNYGGFDWIPDKNPMGGESIV